MSSAGASGKADAPEQRGPALAIFAHPDDAEISAGGTLAKWASAGREVHLLVLTNGDRGSQDRGIDRAELARIRAAETVEGARALDLASATVLDVHDGELENRPEIRAEVVRAIRRIRPATIVSCDPTAWFFENSGSLDDSGSERRPTEFYNHSDHRTAGVIALDSAFPGAGNPHYFAEHHDEGLGPHDVSEVWLGWTNEPNHTEDISEQFETKIAALAEHASQLTEGIRFFEEFLGKEARRSGERIGVGYGEEFRILDLS